MSGTGTRAWLAAACLGLAACSNVPFPSDEMAGEELPRIEMAAVPFYPQEAYQCGPAALATVLGAAGVERSPEALRAAVYLPGRQGSLQVELLAATRRAGLLPYVLDPTPEALLAELRSGHPVLVLQDLGGAWGTRWHYAVVIGYDRPQGQLILRSGVTERLVENFASFDRSWARAGRWAFVALPPHHLPASATPDRLVAAAAGLERVAGAAALPAYAAVLERWPSHLTARLALGNASYWRHDLAAAEAAYRQATIDHPDAAEAWNNLAQTLHEAGRPAEALAAAEQAVRLGGPRQPLHEATRAAIAGAAAH
ncbi:MAG TPA: PA2778 family cysteine peptidase [Azonexus sp.]